MSKLIENQVIDGELEELNGGSGDEGCWIYLDCGGANFGDIRPPVSVISGHF